MFDRVTINTATPNGQTTIRGINFMVRRVIETFALPQTLMTCAATTANPNPKTSAQP